MPTVRKGQRQVSTQALPGVRLTAAETPESRGAGLAIAKGRTTEAIGELAGTVGTLAYHEYGRMQQEERQSANRTAQNTITNRTDKFELDKVHGPQGALQRQGSDAFTLPEEIDQELEKLWAEIEPTLGNAEQKQWFAQFKERRGMDVKMAVARHVNGQIEGFHQQQSEATVKNKYSLAVANAMDPGQRVKQEMADGVAAITQEGQRKHLPQEAIDNQVNAFRSDVHVGVINNLLANEHTQEAQIHFQEAKAAGEIAGDKLDDLTNKLNTGTTRAEAQQETARILAMGGTLTDQRAEAKKINKADVQDDVLARLEHEDGIRKYNEQQTERDNLNTAYNIVTQTHDVNKIPPGLLTDLGTHQPALRSYAESLSRGEPITTNPQSLYDLLTLSSVNPDAFLKTNLMGYMDKVGKEDLEQLMRMQTSMRSGTPKNTDGMFVSERAQNDIVDETLMKAGLVGSPTELRDPKNKALSNRIILFRQSVREAVNRQQQIMGKHVTDDDVQAIVDRLISPGGSRVSKPGYFYDTYQPVFVFETDDARKAAASIPPAYLRQIDDALRRKNLPVDDAHRVELYQRSLNRSGE